MSNYSPNTTGHISLTAQKIQDFRSLPVGWHYQEGIPPTDETVRKALELNAAAEAAGFKKTNAFPGIDGEIAVTAYHQSIYIEMTIEPDGLITFIYEAADREIENQKMTLDQALTRISKFRGITWVLSGLSITGTMTLIGNSSSRSPLNPPVTGAASQLLTQTAFSEKTQLSVSTSSDSIKKSPEHLQYSGIYHSNLYLKIIA